MQVRCEKCFQDIKVDDSRITPQGARIKCPLCGNIITVRPGGAVNSPASSGMGSTQPDPLSNPTPAPASTPSPSQEATWRVRHGGVPYTFHDMESLRNWLSGRGTLDTVEIAKDEDSWKCIGDYPDVLTPELINKFFPLGDIPTSQNMVSKANLGVQPLESKVGAPMGSMADLSAPANPKKNAKQLKQEKLKAEAEKKARKKKLIITGIIIFVALAAVICVLRFNTSGQVINIPQQAPVVETKPAPIKEEVQEVKKTDPEAVAVKLENPDATEAEMAKAAELDAIAQKAEEDLKKRLQEASDLVKDKKWPEARATLESLNSDRPDHIETLSLLAKTYRGLGLNDRAAEIEKHIQDLKDDEKKSREQSSDQWFDE